jgi:hypothetical protein
MRGALPGKAIYDIPAVPVCSAQELIDRLRQHAQFHLGQEITEFVRREDGRFDVRSNDEIRFDAGALVILPGSDHSQPRAWGVPGCEAEAIWPQDAELGWWVELNRQLAREWTRISHKKPPPEDADRWLGVSGKYALVFGQACGKAGAPPGSPGPR